LSQLFNVEWLSTKCCDKSQHSKEGPHIRSARCPESCNMNARNIVWSTLFIWLYCASVSSKLIHHYVIFGQDREKIKLASSFLDARALEGAQVAYSWRQQEKEKDEYDFSAIRDNLAFLTSKESSRT
jgi:hypothetical protein